MHTNGLVLAYKVAIKNGSAGYWTTMLNLAMVLVALIGLGTGIDAFLVDVGLVQDVIRIINFFLVVMLCLLPTACCEAYEIASNELMSDQ